MDCGFGRVCWPVEGKRDIWWKTYLVSWLDVLIVGENVVIDNLCQVVV